MPRTASASIAALAAALLIAGAATSAAAAPGAQPAGTADAATKSVIDTLASHFTYAMEHPMHSWTGTSDKARGSIAMTDGGQPVSIEVTIPVLSFDSGNRNRDSHMAETVESYLFSDVTFHSERIGVDSLVTLADGSRQARWQVQGALTFHGVSQPLTCPVDLSFVAPATCRPEATSPSPSPPSTSSCRRCWA